MTKILIVGGSGFLGRACLEKLSSCDVSVIGTQESPGSIKNQSCKYYTLDIYDNKKVDEFLEGNNYSHLLYLAWPSSPPHNSIEHITFAAASIEFLSKFSEHNSNARITFIGSIHETGINSGEVLNSFANAMPDNLYGISKKLVYDTMHVMLAEKLQDISFCWVRLSNVYGSGDHSHKLLFNMTSNALKGKSFKLNNENGFVDFIHIDDAAKGICLALLSDYNGIVNSGGGQGCFLQDIKRFLEWHLDEKAKLKDDCEINSMKHSKYGAVLDISVANRFLNYVPDVSIEQGISQYADSVSAMVGKNEEK